MNKAYAWYQQLIKPSWAPPSWIFGPVWTVLYILIAASYGTVFYKIIQGELSWIIGLPFILNLIFNFAFTPIQFGIKNNLLATLDIFLILGTLVGALLVIWPYEKWIALINLPYLVWVLFATILQITLTVLNLKSSAS